MKNLTKMLLESLKIAGVPGAVAYIGGIILIGWSALGSVTSFERQVLLMVAGLALLFACLSFIYLRERLIVGMVKESNKALTAQMSDKLSNEQIVSITQTIWQSQRDIVENVFKVNLK